jgi:hypothetical protein
LYVLVCESVFNCESDPAKRHLENENIKFQGRNLYRALTIGVNPDGSLVWLAMWNGCDSGSF